MNSVNLLGRLVREPEVRYNDNNIAVASFTLAVDRNLSKDKREQAQATGAPTADFIRCVAFNRAAETIGKHFAKGQKMGVSGRIQTGSYTRQDGSKAYTTDVLVERFDFAESSPQNAQSYPQQNNYGYQQNNGYQQYNQAPQPRQMPQRQAPPQQISMDDELPEGFAMIDENDVPF